MSRSSNFCSDLREELQRHITSHEWISEWKPLRGSRESVDLAGLPRTAADNDCLILVEIELRREDPASNIIKIWEWVDNRKLRKPLVLFQGFSKIYDSMRHPAKNKKAKNARFVGNLFTKVNRGTRYVPVPFDYLPYKGAKEGGGAREKAAKRLAKAIAARWRKILSAK